MKTRNSFTLKALWTWYRTTVERTGPASVNSRIARKAFRDYSRAGVL